MDILPANHFTQLLRTGFVGGPTYAFLIAVALIVSVAVSRIDVLQELTLAKNVKLTLARIEETKLAVFAKSELVKHMGEELADLVVFNTKTVGRFATDDLDERMLTSRDKIAAVLKDLGSDPGKIAQIVQPINDTVLFDWQ